MKRGFLILLSFITFSVSAQVSDLAQLASGKMLIFSPVMDVDKSLYGYFSIYKLDNIDKYREKFEYVLLDKNLNKVANGEFTDIHYKKTSSHFYYPEKIGNELILSKMYQYYGYLNPKNEGNFTIHRILDLKTNVLSEEFYYENGDFINGNRNPKKLLSTTKKIKTIEFPIAIDNGFVLLESPKIPKDGKYMQYIKAYDMDKKEKWSHNYNLDKKNIEKIFELIDDKNLLYSTKNKDDNYSVMINSLDPLTGKILFKYELENKNSKYSHIYVVKPVQDRFVITGKMSPYKRGGYDYEKAAGLFRIVLDKNGKEISKKNFLWSEAGEYLQMNKKGKIKEGNYKLAVKSYFVFKNGGISVLTEKRKENINLLNGATNVKTTDFVILNFDKEFNLKNVESIKKDKSKWTRSDYLFSQYVKDDMGVVFFYNDYKKDEETKKKNWILGIVSIIDGKMNHEQIPMTSDDYSITPYLAKEGYILLREFNKDSDYDQIRLERLNY